MLRVAMLAQLKINVGLHAMLWYGCSSADLLLKSGWIF
jgi:hypothetical protein